MLAHRRPLVLSLVALLALFAASCGDKAASPDAAPGGGADARSTGGPDAASPTDAGPTDAGPTDAGATDAGATDAPSGTYPLTVKNYLSWCAVTVDGTALATASQTIDVAPGAITLVARPASSVFALGPTMWHHVDGTTGDVGISGTQSNGASTATITISDAGACAWVCCPFTDGSGCDPAVIGDQCP